MEAPPSPHPLLAPPSPEFSSATVQRALIVWTRTGHRNTFPAVCRYYHTLEALESTLPSDQRVASQRLEYDLLSTAPPTSQLQTDMFPNLYPQELTKITDLNILEARKPSNVTPVSNGVTPEEIVAVSEMIKRYCLDHKTNIREFLSEFSQYASKYGINPTVSNVAFFIQYQKVLEEKIAERQALAFKNINGKVANAKENLGNMLISRQFNLCSTQVMKENTQNNDLVQQPEYIQETKYIMKENQDYIANSINRDVFEKVLCISDSESGKLQTRNTDTETGLAGLSKTVPINNYESLHNPFETDTIKTMIKVDSILPTNHLINGMSYAKVAERKMRTFSSLFDKTPVEIEEIKNTCQLIHKEDAKPIHKIMDKQETLNEDKKDDKTAVQEQILQPLEILEKEIAVPSNHEIKTIESDKKETIYPNLEQNKADLKPKKTKALTTKKAKKAKKKKTNKEIEADKENIGFCSMIIPDQLQSSEIGRSYTKSHKDKELCNKVAIGTCNKLKIKNNSQNDKIKEEYPKDISMTEFNDESFHSIKDDIPEKVLSQNEHSEYASAYKTTETVYEEILDDSKEETYNFDLSREAIQRLRDQIAVFNKQLEEEVRSRRIERSIEDSNSVLLINELSNSETIDVLVHSSAGLDCSLGNASNISEDFEVLDKNAFSTSSQ